MVKLIIFDLDGTLVDTSREIQSCVNKSLKKFNLKEITLEETIRFVGNGARLLIERATGMDKGELFEKVYSDFLDVYANSDNNLIKLYEGEGDALKNFENQNIMIAILSNKPQAACEAVFAKFLANFNFCIVLGQTEYYPLKPNPASCEAILAKLKVKKEEALFVGDGETDIQTAKNAGVKSVAALWGFRTKNALKEAGVTLFAEDFNALEKIVNSINF